MWDAVSLCHCYWQADAKYCRRLFKKGRGAVRPHQTQHRATITSPEKMGKLLRDLDNYHGHFQVRCILRLFPLLFVRSTELAGAKWEEFHFGTREWHITAERMKMRLPHIVPLSSQTLVIIEELRTVTGNGLYLFPSRNNVKKPIHYSTPLQALCSLGYGKEDMCFTASGLFAERGHPLRSMNRALIGIG